MKIEICSPKYLRGIGWFGALKIILPWWSSVSVKIVSLFRLKKEKRMRREENEG